MVSTATKKAAVTRKHPSAARKATTTRKRQGAGNAPTTRNRRASKLIDDVTAILLISPDAKRLTEFYKATLGLPLEEEVHDGLPLHYGCALGDVQFAIHSADDGWPGTAPLNAQSPMITFSTSDLTAVTKRLSASGINVKGPTDHGFGYVVSFRDPDGNFVAILEYGPEHW